MAEPKCARSRWPADCVEENVRQWTHHVPLPNTMSVRNPPVLRSQSGMTIGELNSCGTRHAERSCRDPPFGYDVGPIGQRASAFSSGRSRAMLDKPATGIKSKPLSQLPLRLHHHAFAVKDQEVNRRFIEDVLGIPLVATWCERVFRADLGRLVDYCHTFFEMADGSALAFFQFADEEVWELNRAILHPSGAGAWHVAFKATQETFDAIVERLTRADQGFRITDHGYCTSLYCT